MSEFLRRDMIDAKDLVAPIQNCFGPEVSEFLVSKIIELYIQEKQVALESGKAVVEDDMATRYQIRYYGLGKQGEPLFTVKVQNVLAEKYKESLVKLLESDKALLEAYSERDLDRFNDQLKGYLRVRNKSILKDGKKKHAKRKGSKSE